ncbi:hypothetical protein [Nitrosococcus wardiae]|uniref:Uncharacterized protein n=1 Tax=Nitrosococcus wardiae TaxID=1814290 RepID=A0A4P7BZ44_9GAMM|nr:hypothetical protein [Nitrosococcus wardiae]QBQ55351.1 hypothetical protein E3U44_13150 [Nitrosococcus wardiae]
MSKLMIVDLSESKTLDRKTMSSVRGDMKAKASLSWYPYGGDRYLEVSPTQAISQFQGLENMVGNNVANFGHYNVHNTNTQSQDAYNNVNVGRLW